ncbi:hypothetical protein PACTADRAFT_32888 [Pachysolen tannophilus NRRL Y-2460]|uniref:FAM192A/Fyv6 N-terminal domain-containing protein n=1 Tax=Pachysolen tannophilus NRRL Y-2460 TaxID=669874 RepID=A0A1E4U096_PACTA|nr:hypothetical protein PACTADRAFT_32888 [Pachysolen tannophilus NRRL Y-2460]
MDKFVAEGTNTINDEELKVQQEPEAEIEQQPKSGNKVFHRYRKSLQQQLYENRVKRAILYQQQSEKQNSAHKLSEKDLEYYQELRNKEEAKELNIKAKEEESLSEFRQWKAKNDPKRKRTESLSPDSEDLKQEDTIISKRRIIIPSKKKSNFVHGPKIIRKIENNKDNNESGNNLKLHDQDKDQTQESKEPSESADPNGIKQQILTQYSSSDEE